MPSARAQLETLSTDPMVAAEQLSTMENMTHIPALYTLYGHMHPDAQAIVPRFAVIGWYQNDFQPLGPQQAYANGVSYPASWTWGVTGQSYLGVAEVSYSQAFGDGSVTSDIVRLAPWNGTWKWFFGRSPEFVNEQIARFDQRNFVAQQGEVPFGLASAVPFLPGKTAGLPGTITTGSGQTLAQMTTSYTPPVPTWASSTQSQTYQFDGAGGYTAAYVRIDTIGAQSTSQDAMATLVFDILNRPPVTLRGWNMQPPSGYAWASFTEAGSDAVGSVSTVCVSDGSHILTVSAVSDEVIAQLATYLMGSPAARIIGRSGSVR